MRTGLILLSVLSVLALSPAALAQTAPCAGDFGNDTTMDANRCLTAAIDKADAEMKAKYDAVMAVMKTPALQKQLALTQTTWSLYVRQTCDGLVGPFWQGGTIQNTAIASCKLDLTRARTNDLDRMFHVPLHN